MSYENDDAILPDDFQADTPQAEEVQEQPTDTELDTFEPDEVEAEQTEALTPEQLKFKVKYNHEEQELGYDDAIPLIQKGMNYDKIQQQFDELRNDPRLSFVEELAKEQNMDVPQFLDAVRSAREEQQLNDLVQQNIPEEYAKEMLENRKFRQEYGNKQKEQESQAKQEKEFASFLEVFPNVKAEEIPKEVWEAHAQGTPLEFAYMKHEHNQLKSQLKALKQNEQNTKRAPVSSLTEYGSTETVSEDDFLKGFNS